MQDALTKPAPTGSETIFLLTGYVYRDASARKPAPYISNQFPVGKIHMKRHACPSRDGEGYSPKEATEFAATLSDMASDNVPNYVAITRVIGDDTYHTAVPVTVLKSGLWYMYGGNIMSTSDSRFFRNPIKIHDRTE